MSGFTLAASPRSLTNISTTNLASDQKTQFLAPAPGLQVPHCSVPCAAVCRLQVVQDLTHFSRASFTLSEPSLPLYLVVKQTLIFSFDRTEVSPHFAPVRTRAAGLLV